MMTKFRRASLGQIDGAAPAAIAGLLIMIVAGFIGGVLGAIAYEHTRDDRPTVTISGQCSDRVVK